MEAFSLFRAGLPGKEDGHFWIAPLDPALLDGACGERAGQGARPAIEYCRLVIVDWKVVLFKAQAANLRLTTPEAFALTLGTLAHFRHFRHFPLLV